MKDPMVYVERFCRKHPNFGIPNLMLYIAIGNLSIYLLDMFSGNRFSPLLAFSREAIFHGQIWRLVTFVFISESGDMFFRGSGVFFVAVTAYFYYWIGKLLEREWGLARFTCFYLMGVLLNVAFGLVVGYADMYYVNLSLFLAFAVLYPDLQVLLFFIIPVKVKWLAWIFSGFFAVNILMSLLGRDLFGALLPVVAIFNFLLFFYEDFIALFGYKKQQFLHQHSPQTINFRKATKTIYETRGYLHKCAVCGLTDADDPKMDFRYCSKCTGGTYCYCSKHIRDHAHIT